MSKVQFGLSNGHSSPVGSLVSVYAGEEAYIRNLLDTGLHGDSYESRNKKTVRKGIITAAIITLGGLFACRKNIDRLANHGLKRLRTLIP